MTAAESAAGPLISLANVSHRFTLPSGKQLTVLADISVSLAAGELVALLGPSGCGKSTLVRIAAGLLRPTQGDVRYRGEPVTEPNPHAAMVFQQFALFPWLTVSQNIEQALIPRGIAAEERRHRVTEVISLIGLDGFEEAYPRELSGGMKQRVGIARALVVQPELLCMDEPFSQVDALTAEALRNEVLSLWRDREKYPQSILMVSHDIQEVAFMASRILVMTANPGRIKMVVENPLPYPRDTRSPDFQAFVDQLHSHITGFYLPEQEPVGARPAAAVSSAAEPAGPTAISSGASVIGPIPPVEIRQIIGLLEAVLARGGDVEFFRFTAEMGQGFTRILLAVKAAELLGLLTTPQDHLQLTELGRRFAAAPRKLRRQLFREQLRQVPLVKRMLELIEHSTDHQLEKEVLLEELCIQCPQEDPKRLLRILVNWGRFADLWVASPSAIALAGNGSRPGPKDSEHAG